MMSDFLVEKGGNNSNELTIFAYIFKDSSPTKRVQIQFSNSYGHNSYKGSTNQLRDALRNSLPLKSFISHITSMDAESISYYMADL